LSDLWSDEQITRLVEVLRAAAVTDAAWLA
jgi:hypothetical protein